MTKWPGFTAVVCIIGLGLLLVLIGVRERTPATGLPPGYLRPVPKLPAGSASTQPPLAAPSAADDPVFKWMRHSVLGETPVDVLFANPLLPDSQRSGQLIFKVFLHGGSQGRSRLGPSPAQDAMVLDGAGTVLESFEWEVEESNSTRTVGYLSFAVQHQDDGREDIRRPAWIRLVLKDLQGGAAVFEWRLAGLAPRDAFW